LNDWIQVHVTEYRQGPTFGKATSPSKDVMREQGGPIAQQNGVSVYITEIAMITVGAARVSALF